MSNRALLLLPLAAVLALPATSLAGRKKNEVVSVGAADATGSMGATRNTTDVNAKIGCWAVGAPGSLTAACLATDASGATLTCSSTDLGIVKTIQAVHPASHIAFAIRFPAVCDNVVIDDGVDGLKK